MKTQTRPLLPPIDPELRALSKRLKDLNPDELRAALSEKQAEALRYQWGLWARDEQLWPLGDWTGLLIVTGRGWGKNRTGSELVRHFVKAGLARRIGLVARTVSDTRDVMVEGESGILNVHPASERPNYETTKRRITWGNGALATVYTSDEPDLLRGPQHDLMWFDEIATWRFRDAFDNAQMGLRLGPHPRWLATTTPKAVPLLLELMAEARPAKKRRDGLYESQSDIVVTTGSVYDNIANLPPTFINRIIKRYEGTRLGIQELYGQLLRDDPAALWKRDTIHALRVTSAPALRKVVVGVDPAASASEDAGDTGIVVAGVGVDGHGYVLGDYTVHGTPSVWASKVVAAFRGHKANSVVAEINHGGDMVVATLLTEDKYLPVKKVSASRGKFVRGEPIANLYERGLIHHVGNFPELEDQLCTWVPGDDHQRSPDRLDALVWTLSELMLDIKAPRYGIDYRLD